MSDDNDELDKAKRLLKETAAMARSLGADVPKEPPPYDPNVPYCSFCGKQASEVAALVAGPQVFICNECVDSAQEIIRQERVNGKPSI